MYSLRDEVVITTRVVMELLSVTAVRASRFSRAPLECSRHRSPVAAGWLRAEITAGPKRDFSYDRIRLRALWLRSQLAERIPKMSSASMECTVKELCSNRRTGRSAPLEPRTQPAPTTEVTARAHIARARLGLVTKRCLKRCLEVPPECMQGGSLWPGRALERQRSAAHHPCCAGGWGSRLSDQHST